MPAFCYLLPSVLLFDIGYPPAVVATVVFALPAAIRLTLHGLRGVPDQLIEVGSAHGATQRQILRKIELPVARPALLLGLNQTINLALGIVVIAALVGAEGLGQEVLAGLQHLDVGQAFDAGLAIVAVAIVLDRLTAGRTRRAARAFHRDRSAPRVRTEWMLGAAVLVIAVVVGKLWSAGTFPTSINFSLHDPVNSIVKWCNDNLRNGLPIVGGTASISDFIVIHLLDPIRSFLTDHSWWLIVSGFTALAWASAGRRVAAVCAVALLFVAGLHAEGGAGASIWVDTMDTLSQVVVAVLASMAIALPVGIIAGRSDRFFAFIRPILDAMQVMPAFVYLVPVIALFNVGRVPGLIAAIVYALPPGIRLTALGIREVPPETIEAARSTGATKFQILTKVQLPLALRSIMLGSTKPSSWCSPWSSSPGSSEAGHWASMSSTVSPRASSGSASKPVWQSSLWPSCSIELRKDGPRGCGASADAAWSHVLSASRESSTISQIPSINWRQYEAQPAPPPRHHCTHPCIGRMQQQLQAGRLRHHDRR